MKPNPRAERALYFSIWAVILIAFGLWKFRPTARPPDPEVAVELAPAVQPWFSEGMIQRTTPNSLTVGFVLTPEYRKTLRQGSQVTVGYRLSHGETSSEGTAVIRVSPEAALGTTLVNNPSRQTASKIEFFLR